MSFSRLMSSRVLGVGAGRSAGSLLRAIAGCPAGLRETRRGSFLVLVVGTLALMSVFAVVYIAIGRADIGTSVGVKRNAERDDVPDQVAKYIAQEIIAKDVFSTFVDGKDIRGNPIFRREATDFPGTPWDVTSILNSNANRTLDFRPTGTALGSDFAAYLPLTDAQLAATDRNTPSDPWLASLTPTWLNYDGNPPTVPDEQYRDYKDWAQISNIAPDGAFVNLVNLRESFTASATAMRAGLDQGLLTANGTSTNTTDFGRTIVTTNVNLLGKSSKVVVRPADLTMRQRGAFRLATDVNLSPSNVNYPMNQWADADGDGFLDSRWFELVDARNPIQPKSLLRTNGKYRYVFAARIVDLSGLVNVSTATDIVGTPTADAPIGTTPADVDLRRLLTMQDFRDQFNTVAYGAIPRPNVLNGSDDYFQYDTNAKLVGAAAYKALYSTGDFVAGATARPPADRGAALTGIIPPKPAAVGLGVNEFFFGSAKYWSFGDPYRVTALSSAVKDRATLYQRLAGNSASVSQYDVIDTGTNVVSTGNNLLVSIVGTTDLQDLLTYRALNNPEITSNLELILGGRLVRMGTDRYDPLRSNRGLDVERDRLDSGSGRASPAALALMATSVRQYLTTLSGARPIISTRLPILNQTGTGNTVNVALNAKATDSLKTSELKTKITADPQALYKAYAQALIPDARPKLNGLEDTWPVTAGGDAAYNKIRHLNYGGTTPELGAIMSAHLAVNMAAALLSQNQSLDSKGATVTNQKPPMAYTVLLAEDQRATVATKDWAFPGKTLDLGKERLAEKETQVLSPAINVYAIVPEPVITAVGVYHIYMEPGTKPVSMNGEVSALNDDFIGQVLAFHLTNPFNEPIGRAPGAATTQHYIEYGSRIFGVDFSGPLALEAGKTRCYYVVFRGNSAKPIPNEWFNAQFGVDGVAPVEIFVTADRLTTGSTLVIKDLLDPFKKELSPIHPESFDVVRLWRAFDSTIAKDQLVDRFRLPFDNAAKAGRLDQKWNRLPAVPNLITGVDDATKTEGLSITLGTAYRRPRDPNGAITKLESGAPAFMVERKFKVQSLNLSKAARGELGTVADLDLGEFIDSSYGADSLETLYSKQGTDSIFADETYRWVSQTPSLWVGGTIDTLLAQNNNASFNDVRTEIVRWSSLPKETKVLDVVRAGDMLLPLAVGPSFTPSNIAIPTGDNFEMQYTTLSEALALALGYDAPSAGGATEAEKNAKILFTNAFGGNPNPASGAAGANAQALVDRGHLRLDAFTPFIDSNTNGTFEALIDFRRGDGIPLALNVLNVFTAYDAQLDRSIAGQVNLNTASLPVMRALPMLTPPTTASLPTLSPWWFGSHGNSGAANSDIAATVVAYRDKSVVNPRNNLPEIRFDNNAGTPVQFTLLNGRSRGNDLGGVREAPGLASTGELMTMYVAATDPSSIDYLANKLGVTIPDNGVRSGDTTKEMKNSYADKLLIANAVSNIASVRSDVFAVWFMVAGYSKTDVVRGDGTPLLPTDPMVPSVQRRFLMVVDRSNVTQLGQKPRIVLFKEVPL